MNIDNELNAKIIALLREHPEGGENFFNALDLMVRSELDILHSFFAFVDNDDWLASLLHDPTRSVGLVLSGKFGLAFFNRFQNSSIFRYTDDVIIVNGGIRTGAEVELYKDNNTFFAKDYIFLDDSFYSGKTRDGIDAAIKAHNPQRGIIHSFVVYDGSRYKQDNVSSMFKYYDTQHEQEIKAGHYS